VPARAIDAAVEAHVLAAVTPANLELALEVLTQFEQDAAERDRQWQLQLERARYEARRAERQYEAVDPLCGAQSYVAAKLENRLVTKFRRDERHITICTIASKKTTFCGDLLPQSLYLARSGSVLGQIWQTTSNWLCGVYPLCQLVTTRVPDLKAT